MKKTFNYILKILLWICLILFGLLTIFVLIALIARWMDPHTKGISNFDLKNYITVSTWFIGLIILLKTSSWLISSKIEKGN